MLLSDRCREHDAELVTADLFSAGRYDGRRDVVLLCGSFSRWMQ